MVKERAAYSREDETRMWMYLYEQLRKGVPAAWQPKGLEIWKMYALENEGRTADSLNSRFRKNMINKLYDANLPCNVMMYLYLRYQIPMNSDVKTGLELRFQIQIELKPSGTLKAFKRVSREERVQAGRSPMTTPPRQEDTGPNRLFSNESPSTSTGRTPGSLDFTREIHKVEKDSIRRLRLEELAADRNEAMAIEESDDIEDLEDLVETPTLSSASHDENAPQQVVEAHEVPSQSSVLQVAAGTSAEVGQAEGPSAGPGQTPTSGEAIVVDDVVVSTTSDSCQNALDRCFAAYGIEKSSREENDWRSSEKVMFLTSKWHEKMKEVIASYDLTAEGTEGMIGVVSREQKRLLLESKYESDYLRSLLSVKSVVKGELDRLSAAFRSPSHSRPIVKIPDQGYSLQIRNVYENIGTADREEALRNIVFNHMSSSLHPAHIVATLEDLENVEELVAASSANKEDYNAKMKQVEDAVKKRVAATE
ncbi:unnamed protein product [Cylicocyclus nassatus]|uniref:SPK domain-containing protein n=1 Tax=Cylicocyclus nassatus TaxID=53992 RepID=A0AA36GYZ2_CYLNA|nr:unnamed protein product [Cylicocyclus nassatus]